MAFKLRSGNCPEFKHVGSSPAKQTKGVRLLKKVAKQVGKKIAKKDTSKDIETDYEKALRGLALRGSDSDVLRKREQRGYWDAESKQVWLQKQKKSPTKQTKALASLSPAKQDDYDLARELPEVKVGDKYKRKLDSELTISPSTIAALDKDKDKEKVTKKTTKKPNTLKKYLDKIEKEKKKEKKRREKEKWTKNKKIHKPFRQIRSIINNKKWRLN